jgi:hypothetical protein
MKCSNIYQHFSVMPLQTICDRQTRLITNNILIEQIRIINKQFFYTIVNNNYLFILSILSNIVCFYLYSVTKDAVCCLKKLKVFLFASFIYAKRMWILVIIELQKLILLE